MQVNLSDLEARARDVLPADVYGYFAGGAEDEATMAANRAAFEKLAVYHRVLVDVSRRSTRTTVLGQSVAMPVLVAPVGLQGMAHADGELATVRAAGAAGTVMILSTVATYPLEDVLAAKAGPVWFQLYMPADRGAARELVARAQAAGCGAIVLTVDAPLLGRRERDLRAGWRLPAGAVAALRDLAGHDAAPALSTVLNPSLTWDDVDWLRGSTSLPIVLKGLVRADDAERAVAHGAAAIVVSNHGGRQLDGAPATVDALPGVVAAVAGRAEVYVDGGVRRGVDVLKCLALGARAVLVGRPIVWGLAAGGADGVAQALEMLRNELDTAMALAGCRSVAEIGPELLG